EGQILAVFAVGLVALIAGVGLVIEAGNVFAQQRVAQNGSDAAATAGAVIVAESLSGVARHGSDVDAAIQSVAAANGLANVDAEYTDDFGQPIGQPVDPTADIPTAARGVRV